MLNVPTTVICIANHYQLPKLFDFFFDPFSRTSSDLGARRFYIFGVRINCSRTGAVKRDGHVPPVTSRSTVRKDRKSSSRISVSGIRQSQENATPRDDAVLADPGDRMLTARSGPLGLGVPRTLGPAEGSDHLFLLPERALIMDSTHLRQDLAGLDFNLHLNLLHTAPRGNVWLCELTAANLYQRVITLEMYSILIILI